MSGQWCRQCQCPCGPMACMSWKPTSFPARASSIRRSSSRIKDLELLARNGRRRLHQRLASRAAFWRVDRFRRASRLRPRRRHPAGRLAALRAHRQVLRQAVRGRHERQLRPCWWTSRSRWASPARACPSSSTRAFLAACLAYLSHRQRDRVGIVTFDEDIVTHVPPSAKHFNVLLHTLDRAQRRAAGPAAGDRCSTRSPSISSAAASSR